MVKKRGVSYKPVFDRDNLVWIALHRKMADVQNSVPCSRSNDDLPQHHTTMLACPNATVEHLTSMLPIIVLQRPFQSCARSHPNIPCAALMPKKKLEWTTLLPAPFQPFPSKVTMLLLTAIVFYQIVMPILTPPCQTSLPSYQLLNLSSSGGILKVFHSYNWLTYVTMKLCKGGKIFSKFLMGNLAVVL